MATKAHTKARIEAYSAFTLTWSNLATGDEGDKAIMVDYAERSVQVTGTGGVGGKVSIQGSNDGVNWDTLTDPQGNLLEMAPGTIEMVVEVTAYIKPIVLTGDGTTDLTVTMLVRA